MSLNETAWILKHRLITESINKTGDFDIKKINKQVYETLQIENYEKQPENKVVEAVKAVLKP